MSENAGEAFAKIKFKTFIGVKEECIPHIQKQPDQHCTCPYCKEADNFLKGYQRLNKELLKYLKKMKKREEERRNRIILVRLNNIHINTHTCLL